MKSNDTQTEATEMLELMELQELLNESREINQSIINDLRQIRHILGRADE